jgi:hypothetical protein
LARTPFARLAPAKAGDEPRRSVTIESDLAHFGAQVTTVEHATLRAELLAQAIRLAARRSPPDLIGYLYTQERLLDGALPGRGTLAKRFGDGGGFAYLSSHDGEARGFGDLEVRLAAVNLDVFRETAQMLASEWRAAMSDASFHALCSAFAEHAGPLPDPGIPEAGALVVAAVIDERCGVKRAVESLVSWLGDRERFSAAWVDAVRVTVADAREAR